jgi:hypothetical protein
MENHSLSKDRYWNMPSRSMKIATAAPLELFHRRVQGFGAGAGQVSLQR